MNRAELHRKQRQWRREFNKVQEEKHQHLQTKLKWKNINPTGKPLKEIASEWEQKFAVSRFGKICKTFLTGSIFFYKLIVVATTIGGLTVYGYILPKCNISIVDSLNKNDPELKQPFIVTNTSWLPIYNVEGSETLHQIFWVRRRGFGHLVLGDYEIEPYDSNHLNLDMTLNYKDYEISHTPQWATDHKSLRDQIFPLMLLTHFQKAIVKLGPSEQGTRSIRIPLLQEKRSNGQPEFQPVAGVDIDINVSYEYKPFGIFPLTKKMDRYRCEAKRDEAGVLHWYPKGISEPDLQAANIFTEEGVLTPSELKKLEEKYP